MKLATCKTLFVALAIVGLISIGASVASAQTTDTFFVNYFSNNSPLAAVPAATVRLDNPGLTYGTNCAMIYVYAWDQQLSECCGCSLSHNDLRTLNVKTDLTSNPLTGVPLTTGVIKIVAAAVNNSPCNPAASVSPVPNIRAWATHIQNPVGTAYPITETEFSESTLGATELANLQAQCSFVQILGSGSGICSCGTGE